jgi:hypothetical protein
MHRFPSVVPLWIVVCLLGACTAPAPTPVSTPIPATVAATLPVKSGLSADQLHTLSSLKQVDGYPLYTMNYQGDYDPPRISLLPSPVTERAPAWGCSLFTVLLDDEHLLYGRNFDWQFSPALLLYTDPPDGYASVAMVDITYLGFEGQSVFHLADLSAEDLKGLLDAPRIPFDGMNEHGLAIGMAAVPAGDMQADPSRQTIGSLGIIRQVLDHARTVDEAVDLIRKYNIDFDGGPPIHYLIADATGKAALVEFYRGEMNVIPNDRPWHSATNFLRSSVQDPADGNCWRYDRINERLNAEQGQLDSSAAMELLSEVAQGNTQWSMVYQMGRGEVSVAMGKVYENIHTFRPPEEWDVGK